MSDRDERLRKIREKHALSGWSASCQAEMWLLSEVNRLECERDAAAEELARHRSISVRIDGARAGEMDAERAAAVLQEQAKEVYARLAAAEHDLDLAEVVVEAAMLFREHACHCAVINNGQGPKCAPCTLRAAVAAYVAGMRK